MIVNADVGEIRALGRRLASFEKDVETALADLRSVAGGVAGTWEGDAAKAFLTHAEAVAPRGRQLQIAYGDAAHAVDHYAVKIELLQSQEASARAHAATTVASAGGVTLPPMSVDESGNVTPTPSALAATSELYGTQLFPVPSLGVPTLDQGAHDFNRALDQFSAAFRHVTQSLATVEAEFAAATRQLQAALDDLRTGSTLTLADARSMAAGGIAIQQLIQGRTGSSPGGVGGSATDAAGSESPGFWEYKDGLSPAFIARDATSLTLSSLAYAFKTGSEETSQLLEGLGSTLDGGGIIKDGINLSEKWPGWSNLIYQGADTGAGTELIANGAKWAGRAFGVVGAVSSGLDVIHDVTDKNVSGGRIALDSAKTLLSVVAVTGGPVGLVAGAGALGIDLYENVPAVHAAVNAVGGYVADRVEGEVHAVVDTSKADYHAAAAVGNLLTGNVSGALNDGKQALNDIGNALSDLNPF